MIVMRLTTFVVAGAFSATAQAADWWMITPHVAGNLVVEMGDAGSITTDGTYRKLWTHRFYKEPQGKLKSALIQQYVDCNLSAVKEGRYIDFDGSGRTLESGDNGESDSWKQVAPGTVGELIVRFACDDPRDRSAKFLRIDHKIDYKKVADFYLEDGEIVEATPKRQ